MATAVGQTTYAALFCAFRLLCAGVRLASFSSLLLRVLLPSSISPPSPESKLPAVGSGVCIALSGEPLCCGVGSPWKAKAS